MPLNLGYIENSLSNGAFRVRVYYDATWLNGDPSRVWTDAPLIDGPRGLCLDITNTTGRNVKVEFTAPDGTLSTAPVGQGDPVTTGPAAGRSRTAAQMAALGVTTRGAVGNLSVSYA